MRMRFRTWLESEVGEPQFIGFQGNGNPGERPVQLCYAIQLPNASGQDYFMSCVLRNMTLTEPVEIQDPRYDNYGPPRRELLPAVQAAFERDFGEIGRAEFRTSDVMALLAGIFHSAAGDTHHSRLGHGTTPILADALEDAGATVLPSYFRDQRVPDTTVGPYGYYLASRGAAAMAIISTVMGPQLRQMAPQREDEQEPRDARIRGARVQLQFAGRYWDEKGVLWDVWDPCGNAMSAYVQLTCPGRQAKHVYDAGRGFRANVRRGWIEAGRPSREEMERNPPERPSRRRKK